MLLVGSGNPHKIAEIVAILADLEVPVTGAEILPEAPAVEESGETFEANARLKARHFALRAAALPPARRPRWVVADDSGLCVAALGGAPGVRSARYAGELADAAANNRKLLAELADVPAPDRGASFVCVLACAELLDRAGSPDGVEASGGVGLCAGTGARAGARSPGAALTEPAGEPWRLLFTVRGECHGSIAFAASGAGGFGYDPLFIESTTGRTFAELDAATKNRLSHRGIALRDFRERFRAIVAGAGAGAGAGGRR